MASSFIARKKADIEQKYELKKNDAKEITENEINALEQQKQAETPYTQRLALTMFGFGILAIILTASCDSPIFLILGAPIGFLAHKGIIELINSGKRKSNEAIDARIQEKWAEYNSTCRRLDKNARDEYENEKQKYLKYVKNARDKYLGDQNQAYVVKWLSDEFEKKILAATRAVYNQYIEAKISFSVHETEIVLLRENPHRSTFERDKAFSFKTNGIIHYIDHPDLMDRIGYTQAITQRVVQEIEQRFPKDPICPVQGIKPAVEIDYDDCDITITYKVLNPNYHIAC